MCVYGDVLLNVATLESWIDGLLNSKKFILACPDLRAGFKEEARDLHN